ncbi:MAG TPA: hypothetical protein VMN39_02850, partial [Longimicrobiaceae bacterium]|nr:hypothetical protein [Longimicrobiaceae bacterium]
MLRFLFGVAFLLSLLAAGPLPGLGQGPSPSTAADSTRLHRSARSQQADFERIRRNRLPEVWRGGSGRCDERIGRFCLTHSRDRSNWEAPPEHPEVLVRRNELIENLERTARQLPGDDWVAGQWVRYLVEAGRFEEAIVAARACRAEPSWCHALAGFAHHYGGLPARA